MCAIELEVRIEKAEKTLGVIFQNKQLLLEALTHYSYLYKNPSHPVRDYNILEFLGDSVIQLIITEAVHQAYPDANEGELTIKRSALVNTGTLASISRALGLHKLAFVNTETYINDPENMSDKLCCDLFESVVGGLYKDQGLDVCRDLLIRVMTLFKEDFAIDWCNDLMKLERDTLQKIGLRPRYQLLSKPGKHSEHFVYGCYVGNRHVSSGEAPRAGQARLRAAYKARKNMSAWLPRVKIRLSSKKDSIDTSS